MIRFTLGEDRHVKYFVHSAKTEYFVIKAATYELLYAGIAEAAGTCDIVTENDGYYVDVKIQPMNRSNMYVLEISLEIADEIIKNREQMEVV